ncbi:MAG: hypothetical protein KGL59_04205 [Acidobacteriota bacterium]|nr:hypothetical protein [Acidobacteriota bacterium]
MGSRRILLLSMLALLAAVPAAAQEPASGQTAREANVAASAASEPTGATITFQKIFKQSTPEFVRIKVNRNGESTYDIRQLDDEPSPESFAISPALAGKIFALAADLQDFNGVELEVRRRVANLGEKTFSYEKGGVTNKVSFNFTTNESANKLLSIFEGLSLEDQYADQLRRSMRFDPLGLNDVLIRLERDLGSDMLPDPQALVPILNQIASNSKYLDIARDRARVIVASLHTAP